ncbi:hypothetical protein [Helicobacter sp. UBA3407]|uniref:hypothetical protein n=1 Tax=Helicobacter sp. UBA3407 TaxID=1946588 RepID=UPI00261065C5|nr:hypothetical protein [Helicobacter sp. UBA3407]
MKRLLFLAIIGALFIGCGSSKNAIVGNTQSVEQRAYQSKSYEQPKLLVARAVSAALQDLGFVTDRINLDAGSITATKYEDRAQMQITITLREQGKKSVLVRANARIGIQNVDSPEAYQAFFSHLDKAIFFETEGI